MAENSQRSLTTEVYSDLAQAKRRINVKYTYGQGLCTSPELLCWHLLRVADLLSSIQIGCAEIFVEEHLGFQLATFGVHG